MSRLNGASGKCPNDVKKNYGGGPDFAVETASSDVQLIDNVPIKTRS